MKIREDLNKIIGFIDTNLDIDSYQNYSLYNGMPGLMIYYYYLGKYLQDEKFTNKANIIFNKINDALESGSIRFRIFHSLSYGITGIAYSHWHLNRFGLMDMGENSFSGIEDLLIPCCEDDFTRGVTDNLHGPMGVFYYLSKVVDESECARKAMDKLLDLYCSLAVKDEWGLRIKNNSVKEVHETEYNMSLSHGLCGNLSIFAEAYVKGYRSNRLMEVIQEGLKYIRNTEKPVLDVEGINSHFPSFFSEHNGFDIVGNKENYNTRLAWCYGDLNVALLYLRLGKALNDKPLFEKGISIAENTLWRKTRMQAQVADVYFCHGACGLAYLYFKLYHLTGREQFKEQSAHWMEITSERLQVSLAEGNEENPFSLLEGYPGVALVYLSMLSKQPLPWDDIILLNF